MAMALAGCGGSSGTSPAAYVKSVCTTLGKWSSSIRTASSRLQSASTGATSLANGKQQYVAFIRALVSDTDTAVSRLKDAGAPNIKNGKQISSTLVSTFTQAKAGLSNAASEATRIPVSSAAAYQAGASGVSIQIRQTLSQMAGVAPERDPQLRAAATKDAACRALRNS